MSDERPPRPDPLAVEPDDIPEKLRDRDQWVAWRYKWDTDRDEWTKVPIEAGTGRFASATESDTWTSYADALAFHENGDSDTDGVGFVVHEGGTVAGLDFDDCRDPETGDVESWAADALDDVSTYAEVSPSGTGLRLFGIGFLPGDGNRADVDDAEGHIEMYDKKRFLTVTGRRVDAAPEDVEQVHREIGDLHARHIADDENPETSKAVGDGGVRADSPGTNPGVSGPKTDLDDDELLEKAKNAENGDKFRQLWEGRTVAGLDENDGQSERDLALVNLLAFWTGGDRRQIDRLFRSSGLYRGKWDRDDYRERTIDKALNSRTDFYDPSSGTEAPEGPSIPDEPGDVDNTDDTGEAHATLSRVEVMARAGLGEDDDISDLDDRQKAACVWDLLRESDEFHVRVRRDNGSLWAYDGGIWTNDGDRALRHAARRALGSMNYGQNVLAELKAQAQSDPAAEVGADEFGVETGYLAVDNGLVNLDAAADGAGEDALRDLRPDDYALTQLPVEYEPSAEADEWAGLVDEWTKDGKADALQEYVGYCLHVGALPIHRALLLVGSGANGKGTFLGVVRELLGGRDNTSSTELQTLANEPDAVADFYGSLANIDDDLSSRKLGQGLGMFKKLVGGDYVRGRKLYEDGFEFEATGKHLYAANETPDVDVPDDDEAFWRRWLLIEFPNYYPPSERDPELGDRLTEPEALSGVLNWAIEGRRRLLENGLFTGEDRLAHEVRTRWQSWGDAADEFIGEHVERDESADRITTGDAFRRFEAWCRANGKDHDGGQQGFTNTLKNEDVGYGEHRIDGTVTRGYKALGFADDVPDLSPDDDRGGDGDSRQGRLG